MTIPRRVRRRTAVLATALALAALALVPAARAQAPAVPLPAPTPVDVRVMTFNIWLGGDQVDFAKVVEAIAAARADIVGLQEAEGNTRRIAEALHWPYWSDRMHVVSRFPLIDPPEAHGEYVLAQIRPGQVFALANEHLTSDPYGPYLVRSGRSLAQVLANERATRVPEIDAALRAVRPALRRGIPTFFTGDFNTPSALDWTPAIDAVRGDVHYPVPWPVTRALSRAGFTDTYRAIHPDPVATPGITWTFGYPFPRRAANEVIDRIDFVQASPGVQVLDSGIVGPSGTPDVTYPVDPYPSDHRAVVSTVRFTPAVPAPFASVLDRSVVRGDTIAVRYAAPRGEGIDTLRIVRAGRPARDAVAIVPPQEASFFGEINFGSGALSPGRYDALLVTRGDRVLSRSTFWVVAPGARPTVSAPPRVRAGRAIRVSWTNAPGFRRDWVGIWKAGDNDLYNDYLTFVYTGATVAGRTTIAGDRSTYPPGRYVVRLVKDDGYGVLAQSSFTVTR
jgi:endonuclease/exonuclease/phosphatase family metal-dependent hydrolase